MNYINKVCGYDLPTIIIPTILNIPCQIQDLLEPMFLRNIKGHTLRDNEICHCNCKAGLI